MGLFDVFKNKPKKEVLEIIAPINGKIIPIEQVPDTVFAEKMVGDGIAIDPTGGEYIFAPVEGKVEKIFETNHAFSIVSPEGVEIFVHFGIDTVQLEGKGFERLVEEGKSVKEGAPIIKYDLDFLRENAKSVITPVVISNYEEYNGVEKSSGEAKEKETVVAKIKL